MNIDPNKQFYYRCHLAWTMPTEQNPQQETVTVHDNPLVHRVRKTEHHGFAFEFVTRPGVEYSCTYGWAFVESTPEGTQLLYQANAAELEHARTDRKYKAALHRLPTLDKK